MRNQYSQGGDHNHRGQCTHHTLPRVHTTNDNTSDLTILHIIILIPSSTMSEVFIYVARIVNTLLRLLLPAVDDGIWGHSHSSNTSVDCHTNFPEAEDAESPGGVTVHCMVSCLSSWECTVSTVSGLTAHHWITADQSPTARTGSSAWTQGRYNMGLILDPGHFSL